MIQDGFYSNDPEQFQDHIFWKDNSCYKCGLFKGHIYIPDYLRPEKQMNSVLYTCERCGVSWSVTLTDDKLVEIDRFCKIAHQRDICYNEFVQLEKELKEISL